MSAIDPRALRSAFGSFMTGVTVVTTRDAAGECFGFTANSFTSVSMDPPLLLVCPGRFLSSFVKFESCTHFAVSVLAEGQETVSNIFASFKGDRFAQVPTTPDCHGIPVMEGAAATFSCKTHQIIDAGDHIVLMGQVAVFEQSDKRGLGYAGGKYFSLGLEQKAARAPARGLANIASAIVESEGKILLIPVEGGFALPQVEVERRGLLRDALIQRLEEMGLNARLGQAYSIYDRSDSTVHHTCFRASMIDGQSTHGQFVPIDQLGALRFPVPGQGATLTRYAGEYLTGQFGLYVGDVDGGDLHYS